MSQTILPKKKAVKHYLTTLVKTPIIDTTTRQSPPQDIPLLHPPSSFHLKICPLHSKQHYFTSHAIYHHLFKNIFGTAFATLNLRRFLLAFFALLMGKILRRGGGSTKLNAGC